MLPVFAVLESSPGQTFWPSPGMRRRRSLAAAALRRRQRRPLSPNPRWPSDLDRVAQIQSKQSQTRCLPVNQARFAHKPLCFIKINPPSTAVEKYLRKSPLFYVFAPAYKV